MVNRTYAAIVAIVVIIVVVVAAFALTSNNSEQSMDSSMNMSDDTNSSDELQATVTIENGTLNPANLTVKPGTTVTWIVKDDSDTEYMITSNESGSVEGKYLFMSDHLTTGQSFSYTFNETGTFGYYDMDHMDDEKLIGTIVVQ